MRDEMQVGDKVLFYASNASPSGVTGLAEIVRAGYPDDTAWTPGHRLFRCGKQEARRRSGSWSTSDSSSASPATVPLDVLKQTPGLEDMMVTRKGSRLSVQPVAKAEYDIVVKLGRSAR